ncbi:DgyrCDS11173 [Dimorphilus gyrociliatus]|uniref:DgyrCDS11173 n=1 Tax=Dimorphilus gyrociliatus TaxID=2664684 RepID=A0A7I8W3J0_9ANNE|nr:DgyrCDS11173 [Dimorphilus gyrociliatus]
MSSAHCNLKFKCRFCQFVARNPNHLRKHLNRYHVDLIQSDDLERLEYGTPVNQINDLTDQDSSEKSDEVIVNLSPDGAQFQYMYVTAE